MENQHDSVYDLLTRLCERMLASNSVPLTQKNIQKLRSKSYELLLNKRIAQKRSIVCLPDSSNPFTHALAWRLVLIFDYDMREHAEKIGACIEKLQNSVMHPDVLKSVLHVLLELKDVPVNEDSVMFPHYARKSISVSLPKSGGFYKFYDPSAFRLPEDPICSIAKYSNESFVLPKEKKKRSFIRSVASMKHEAISFLPSCQSLSAKNSRSDLKEVVKGEEDGNINVGSGMDDGSELSCEDFDIWDHVSKLPTTERRTWETIENPMPSKELPFIPECSAETATLLYDYQKFRFSFDGTHYHTLIISKEKFISDVKYVLVGVSSRTFVYDDNNQKFQLAPNVSVEGISQEALKEYCREIVFCGTIYKELSEMIAIDPCTGERKQKGIIFLELCRSIERYLLFYRIAALSLPTSDCLFKHHDHVKKLSTHLRALASICQVSSFSSHRQIPHGVALLNYLYNKILELLNKDVTMVLYSILYPCLQIYFNCFLRQWLMEGHVVDSYNEFFIMVEDKYLSTRGRTYWTRSFKIREDLVPKFLFDLRYDILNCGKAMNLLKLCAPNSATCRHLMGKKTELLQCCMTNEQLRLLENNVRCYYLELVSEGGPRFSLHDFLNKSKEEEGQFFSMVAIKRADTIKRIEMEKVEKIKQMAEKKMEETRKIREQLEMAVMQKELAKMVELEHELKLSESLTKMKLLEEKIIKEEAANMIKYYDNLFEVSLKRKESLTKHMEAIKRYQLDGDKENVEHSSSTDTFTTATEKSSSGTADFDVLNANCKNEMTGQSASTAFTTHEMAALNKRKVLGSELSFNLPKAKSDTNIPLTNTQKITLERISSDSTDLEFIAANVKSENELIMKNEDETNINRTNELQVTLEEGELVPERECGSESIMQSENVPKTQSTGSETEKRNCSELETHSILESKTQSAKPKTPIKPELTDLQKNRLKVLTQEYGQKSPTEPKPPTKELTDLQKNRLKILTRSRSDTVIQSHTILSDNQTDLEKNRFKILNHPRIVCDPAPKEKVEPTELQRNRSKVLNQRILTDLERNRNKVLTQEYGLPVVNEPMTDHGDIEYMSQLNNNVAKLTQLQKEKLTIDNERYLNTNNEVDGLNNYLTTESLMPAKKNANLKLDIQQVHKVELKLPRRKIMSKSLFGNFKSPNFEFPRPMSVDSTPSFEFSPLPRLSDTLSTAASNFTDEGFNFQIDKDPIITKIIDADIINRFASEKVDDLSVNCINHFVQQSIAIPLKAQTSLVLNDLLKYYMVDMRYTEHLKSLRNYFFLVDGEFGRNITDGLFKKLYSVDTPQELINAYTLKHLIFRAIDYSLKQTDNSKYLSFKINKIPKRFDLGDIGVLDCLSLSYKVEWPLNILLPSDTIAKYDDIFKFLLKLHRVSWVLKKIFMEMKLLTKQTGKNSAYLVLSPQYLAVHHYRHIMTHFVQTLQTYIAGEVIQGSYTRFEKDLESVINLDQLYYLHTGYIKNILFMCLLNQRSAPIREVINKIFIVILKFYDYLRSRQWEFDEDCYIHPNHHKLESIFQNFVDFVQFLFKAGKKVAKIGYQPQLIQLVDMLDVNGFYSNLNIGTHSQSGSAK